MCQVYSAGEEYISGADGSALFHAIKSRGEFEPTYLEDVYDLSKVLTDVMKPNDVILTMGAGSIGRVSRSLLPSSDSSHENSFQ